MYPRHPSRSRHVRIAGGALVAALALSVAACGDDDDDDAVDTAADVTLSTDVTTTQDATTTTGGDTTTTDAATTTTDGDATTTSDRVTTTTDDDASTTTDDDTGGSSLADAVSGESVDVFLSLLNALGIDEVTNDEDITILAPADDAFVDIDPDTLGTLLTDLDEVRDVLEAHVIVGELRSSELEDGTTITALSGAELPVSIEGDTVMIGDATVTRADIEFDRGVIHVIDTVLQLPES